MKISYSFHISSKDNGIKTKQHLQKSSKHNARKFENEKYDREQIEILMGTTNPYQDIKKLYEDTFEEVLKEYNKTKTKDRQIKDYFEHISNSRTDLAVEIIIMIGDKDTWENVEYDEKFKEKCNQIFKEHIEKLQEIYPGFKIASAIAHYDESSPHIHILGIPIAEKNKTGMDIQIAKTRVFTQETLREGQEKLHDNMQMLLEKYPLLEQNLTVKPKEKGRNVDIPLQLMKNYNEITKTLTQGQQIEFIKQILIEMQKNNEKIIEKQNNLEEKYKSSIFGNVKIDKNEFKKIVQDNSQIVKQNYVIDRIIDELERIPSETKQYKTLDEMLKENNEEKKLNEYETLEQQFPDTFRQMREILENEKKKNKKIALEKDDNDFWER